MTKLKYLSQPKPGSSKEEWNKWAEEAFWLGDISEYRKRRQTADDTLSRQKKATYNMPVELDEVVITSIKPETTETYKDSNNVTSEYNQQHELEEFKRKYGYYPSNIITYNPVKAFPIEQATQKNASFYGDLITPILGAVGSSVFGPLLASNKTYTVGEAAKSVGSTIAQQYMIDKAINKADEVISNPQIAAALPVWFKKDGFTWKGVKNFAKGLKKPARIFGIGSAAGLGGYALLNWLLSPDNPVQNSTLLNEYKNDPAMHATYKPDYQYDATNQINDSIAIAKQILKFRE